MVGKFKGSVLVVGFMTLIALSVSKFTQLIFLSLKCIHLILF